MQANYFENIPAENYRAWEAFSITDGLLLAKSPGHYWHRKNNPISPTPAMRLGTLIHSRILEPESFFENHLIVPSFISKDRRTKERKAWEEENILNGLQLVESAEAVILEAVALELERKQTTAELLALDGSSEVSLLWEEQGIVCKGRVDRLSGDKDGGFLIDVKTTQDASPEAFARTIAQRGYHIQMAHYFSGVTKTWGRIEHCLFIAIETEPPYGVAVFRLPDHILKLGLEHHSKLIKKYRIELEKNTWESYPDLIQPLNFSEYHFSSFEKSLA